MFLRRELFDGKHPYREVIRSKNDQMYAQNSDQPKQEPIQSSGEETQTHVNSWSEIEESSWQRNSWGERANPWDPNGRPASPKLETISSATNHYLLTPTNHEEENDEIIAYQRQRSSQKTS